MAFMKFYVGNEANASSHRDGIYIAIDTKKIFYNGDAYGGSEVDLSNYATKADLNKYLPLSGGKIYGDGLIISSKLYSREFPSLFMNIKDYSIWAENIGGADYLPDPDTQGLIVSVATNIAGSPDGKVYTCLRAGGIIFSSGMGSHSCYGKNFVAIGNAPYQLQTDGCNGSINLTDTINFYSNGKDGYEPSKLSSISSNGFTIKGKTANDLLNAAGGTVSINDIMAKVPSPDLSSYATKEEVGSNVYTGANYISKETNLTDAVLQLDTEIKATNDNLTLEHENAEATYAKKTELSNQIEAVQANVDSTNTKIVNAKLSMASWTSGANATKLTFTGSSVGLGGTPAIFFARGGITGGGNTIPTQACIRFEGCHIYQDSNGFYVSLPKASDTSDGVMSGEDHKKLGGILNTTKNWVNEVRNDSIPTLPSSATVYKIMDLPGMSAECRASLYLICVQISGSSDKPRIYHNDETLCYLQPVVNGIYQYATGIMVLPDYSISGIYLGETYDYTNN